MSRYKAYPEYRNSGVTWLGKTPATWTLAPLKWFIERNDGGVWGNDPDGENDTLVLRSTEQTVDGFWKMDDPAPRKLSTSEKEFALLRTGDLVVTKSSGSSLHIGKTTIVTDEIERMQCCYSNFMQRIRTSQLLLPKLAWYVMNNELSRAQFDFLSNSTTGLANLNGTMVGQIVLAIPSEVEQQAIINFLDHETAKIDALIEKQQRLIELLKEKRQAVISHAVTKGLNPNAPMKDSGVEWLGEVPAHWDAKRIKNLSVVKRGASPRPIDDPKYFDDDGEYAWVRIADVSSSGMFLTSTTQRLSSLGASLSVKLEPNQLFVSIAGTVGKPCLTTFRACIHDGFVYFPELLIDNKFLYYIFAAGEAYLGLGKMGTQLNLNTETVGGITIGVPPADEIMAIIKFIEQATAKYDGLISNAERLIELAQERRTALISAAVTGKIDVRDWQAAV